MTTATSPARSRATARKDLPGNFIQRTVDAASAPALVGCKPSSPFKLAPEATFADGADADVRKLDANFFRGGMVRFAIDGAEVFLSRCEVLDLASRLVAHVAATEREEGG